MKKLNLDEVQAVSGGFLVFTGSFFAGMQEFNRANTMRNGALFNGVMSIIPGAIVGVIGTVAAGAMLDLAIGGAVGACVGAAAGFAIGGCVGAVESYVGYTVGSYFIKPTPALGCCAL